MCSLDDVLPNCDFDDCWSRNNPDRAYGDAGFKFTANGNENAMERHWIAMGGDSDEFWACEVCANNAGFQQWKQCDICEVNMATYGIVLYGREFCHNCLTLDTIYDVINDKGYMEILDEVNENLEHVDDMWTEIAYASRGKIYGLDQEISSKLVDLVDNIESILLKLIDTRKQREAAAEESRKRKRVTQIQSLFPSLTPEEAEDIDDGLDIDDNVTVYQYLKRMKK